MMDISKILDFHRMVMLAAAQQSGEDETNCGPLCQHPACWQSKRRQERGAPRLRPEDAKGEKEDDDLPTVSYYNMLEDYGESPKDRYPARFGGRAPHDRSSSMRNMSQPLRSASFGMTTAPFATPVSPDKASRSSLQPGMGVVEVQEVFDTADLNSRWDQTFLTKQYLVWVPNPHRTSANKPLAITEKGEGTKAVPKMLKPKDLTEAMVPLQIQHKREDTILFDDWPVLKKRQDRARSPIFQKGTYPRSPLSGIKPDVDSEGDFVSRDKIHTIIQDVLDNLRDGRSVQTGRDLSPPRTGALHTGDVLLQQKAPLHYSRQSKAREVLSLPQQPVFQLDEEDKDSSVDSARITEPGSRVGPSARGAPFSKYHKPLPAICGEDLEASQESPRGEATKARRKIPSISLGLPELPSGLRHTRAFVYNSRHRPDFSLVPVPTPPQSERSSESSASEHGTTLHVNIPSMSETRDDPPAPAHTLTEGEEGGGLHGVSPTLSTHVPKAPAGTPATFHSPTKMYRDFTAASSSMQGGDHPRGLPPSREITMSPGHKISMPPAIFGEQVPPSPDDLGLSTIKETGREQSGLSPARSSQQRAMGRVQFSESSGPGEGGRPLVTSPDDWPQVTEPTFDTAAGMMGSRSDAIFMTEHSMMAEHGSSLQRGRSDLSSRGSERNTLARRILDEGAKVESPAPPPPSPEPKEFGDKSGQRGKREDKSRESNAMEPLMEQSESEGSTSPEKRSQADKVAIQERPSTQGQSVEPVIQEEVTPPVPPNQDLSSSDPLDPVSKVMVSHVAPRPSASREKLQQTFVNVDIPAEDMSSLHAEQGSTPPDFTPSASASPAKLSTPKSSAGPSSPARKTPPGHSGPKRAKGRKNGRGRRGSGDGGVSTKEEMA